MKQLYIMLFGLFMVTISTAQDYVRHEPFALRRDGAIIPADFDGDGDADIYISGYAESWEEKVDSHIYENLGNGNYSPDPVMRFTGIGARKDLEFDYNKDGLPDLVLMGDSEVVIYQNLGNFQFSQVYRGDFIGNNDLLHTDGVIVDYNNDGYDDVLISSVGSNNRVLLNNGGSGNFSVTDTSITAYGSNGELYVTDINNDGRDDLIQFGTYDGYHWNIESYIQNISGVFQQVQKITEEGYTEFIGWFDLDNDDVKEFILGDSTEYIIIRHVHNGIFEQETTPRSLGEKFWVYFYRDNDQLKMFSRDDREGNALFYSVGENLSSFQAIENDSYDDLFPRISPSSGYVSEVIFVDIDNDNDIDIITQGSFGYGVRAGQLIFPPFTFIYYNVTGEDTSAIDFDGDGLHNEADFNTNNYNPSRGSMNIRIEYDPDGDGAEYWDNCPNVYNSDQTDTDGDGIGDVCDDTPGITELHNAIGVVGSELSGVNQIEISSTQNRSLIIQYINNVGEESTTTHAISPNNPYVLQGLADGQHQLHLSVEGTAYQNVYYNLFFNH